MVMKKIYNVSNPYDNGDPDILEFDDTELFMHF